MVVAVNGEELYKESSTLELSIASATPANRGSKIKEMNGTCPRNKNNTIHLF